MNQSSENNILDVNDNKPVQSSSALIFIFITILVDVIGIGIIIPVVPKLIINLTGSAVSDAATIGGLLMISYSVMQFLFAPFIGELSDRFGRRPVLLISLLGLGIDYIFHAFAPTLAWLFVGRFLAGITGASFTVASAYIADVSTPENKAKNFGLIGAAFGLGFILGPLIGGYCAQWGVQVPFFVAAALTLLNFMFGFAIVPESLPKEKRRPINFTNIIPGVALFHLSKYKSLIGLIIAFALAGLAGQVLPSTWSFFTIESFNWNESQIGISLAVVGFLVGIVQALLIGIFVKQFGTKRVIIIGFIFLSIGMVWFCFASNPWILYAALVPYVLGGIAGPTIQGVMSNFVSEKEQGNLQGALTQLMSLAAIVGPILYTGIFTYFTANKTENYFPGAPYMLSAFFIIIACITAILTLRKFTNEQLTQNNANINSH